MRVRTRSIPARELMLPLAHLTTLTGSITLIGTSSNLLIAGIAKDSGVSMTMLSFAPVALPVALVGIALLYFAGPRMLRGTDVRTAKPRERSPEKLGGSPEVVEEVQAMAERNERVRTTPTGPTLTVRLTEPLSILVASVQVLRNLGVTDAIETEGHAPASPGLALDAVG